MSNRMYKQQITLVVSYDPDVYDDPEYWDWSTLADSYCRVISSESVERIFDDLNEVF